MQEIRKHPKVSVVIRTFKQAAFTAQSIKSVQTQKYPNLEIIVVNDCSPDDTRYVVESLARRDARIKLVNNEPNQGRPESLNVGLRFATGKYLANLDGDDYWLSSEKISRQVAWLEKNPDHILVGCFVQNVDRDGKRLDTCSYDCKDLEIKAKLLVANQLAASAVLVRRQALVRAGGWTRDIKYSDDLGMWLKVGQMGKFANIAGYWTAHRQTGFNIGETMRKEQIEEMLSFTKNYKKIYPNYYRGVARLKLLLFALSLPRSIVIFLRSIRQSILRYAR